MTPVPIKERETEEYALNQPDMIRVDIQSGVVVDNREKHYSVTLNSLKKEVRNNG